MYYIGSCILYLPTASIYNHSVIRFHVLIYQHDMYGITHTPIHFMVNHGSPRRNRILAQRRVLFFYCYCQRRQNTLYFLSGLFLAYNSPDDA
jgi:hypothetical protein